MRTHIPKTVLKRLYQDERLSTYSIAARYACDPKTIYRHLVLNGIRPRPRKRIALTKSILVQLYLNQKKSLKGIAKAYGYSPAGILKKCKEYDIPRRSISETSTKHEKHNFNGTRTDKAYLIGFRLGDLGIRERKNLLHISSGTTKLVQANLIQKLFLSYGPIWIGRKDKRGAFNVSCSLNRSFLFLLPKHNHIPQWIMRSRPEFLSFLAGYTDAEGNFGLPNGRASFRIRSCDRGILRDLYTGLIRIGIRPLFALDRRAGLDSRGVRLNKDCWKLALNNKDDLENLLIELLPLLRHEKRIADAALALQNIEQRATLKKI